MFFNKAPQINPTLCALNESFNDHELSSLSTLGTVVELPAGAVLAREGAVGQEAVVVISGTALVVRDTETIATAGPSTILGEIALLTGEARNASLIAETDLVISVLNRREFNSWLNECPRIERQVNDLAASRS